MRFLVLSTGICILILGTAWAQTSGKSGAQQLPVGQTFKNFQFPIYQNGQLKYTLESIQATGITQNRASTTDLKIQAYDNGVVTTTVTSPKADLYVNEQKMRTKDTVQIVRADMEATSQICDFDLGAKKFLMRTNVKVILKNFDATLNPNKAKTDSGAPPPAAGATPEPASTPVSVSPPLAPRRTATDESLLDSPGSYSSTNSAPLPTDNK